MSGTSTSYTNDGVSGTAYLPASTKTYSRPSWSSSSVVWAVTVQARHEADAQATVYAAELADRYGDEVDKVVGNGLRTARDLAGTMVALKSSNVTDRATYDRVLRELLEAHPDYLGTWAVFEPDALDGKDAQSRIRR